MAGFRRIVCSGIIYICAYFVIAEAVFSDVSYKNFDKLADGRSFLVLLFFSPDCDGCPNAQKVFERAGTNFKDYNEVVFGSVNIEKDRILALRFSIENVPSIVFLPYKKTPMPYLRELDHRVLTETVTSVRLERNLFRRVHMNEHLLGQHFTDVHNDESPVRSIGVEDFQTEVLDSDNYVLLLLHDDSCKESCLVFDMVARVFRDDDNILFLKLHTEGAEEITEMYQSPSTPSILWFLPQNRIRGKIYGGEISLQMLVAFINSKTGAERDFDGRIHENAGRIQEIDDFLKKHIIQLISSRGLNHILISLKSLVETLDAPKRFIDYYVKIVQRTKDGMTIDQILEKENDYITQRLSARKISNRERDEWTKFRNIISGIVDLAAEQLMEVKGSDQAQMAIEMAYQQQHPPVEKPAPSEGYQKAGWVTHDEHFHDEL